MSSTDLRARLEAIRGRIHEAGHRAGRDDDVQLVAVSKTVEPDRIRSAFEAGQSVFGENRVQEAVAKMDALSGLRGDLTWHMLGHVQTNKARLLPGRFAWVQAVDSVKLAELLNRRAAEVGLTLPILLEVNVAGEATKLGFEPESLRRQMGAILALPALAPRGLMTVAPSAPDGEDVRWVFRALRALRDEIREQYALDGFSQLSMGMSNDYEVAVEEGATMVRIGRALFGDRPTAPGVRDT